MNPGRVMIEPQRPILLPPSESMSALRARTAAVAPSDLPAGAVAAAPPTPDSTAEDARDAGTWARRTRFETSRFEEEEEDGAAGSRRPWRMVLAPTSGAMHSQRRTATGPAAPFASAAFLAQHIYQEAMSSGLHLEPWAEGIGAYRRAGAAPPLEDAGPAVFSLAV